jgi:predicted secreted protein
LSPLGLFVDGVTGIIVYLPRMVGTFFCRAAAVGDPLDPNDPGHAAGAPQRPRMLLKMAIMTAVSALIWLGVHFLVRSPWLNFRKS